MKSQASFLTMFPRMQHINFRSVLARLFSTKIDPWICLQCLQTSAKTTVVNLQNTLLIFMTFHIALLLKKELLYRMSSTTVSGDSCYDEEVMEWVMDEVVINTSYNHVVIFSNKSYSSYKIIFSLYEYIYVYVNHF